MLYNLFEYTKIFSHLAFAPNGRKPRLLVAWESRWAEIMPNFIEPGGGEVIEPSIKIKETAIAIFA